MAHRLESMFNAPAADIMEAICHGFRAQVDVKGKLAELYLSRHLDRLQAAGAIERYEWHDKDGVPDFVVHFQGVRIVIECKNVRSDKGGPTFCVVDVSKQEYIPWFLGFAREVFRVLTDDGSFVIDIGGSYEPKQPTRSLYHFKLLVALVEDIGFHLAQEFYWYNPGKMPAPAEWVTVRRIRVKDSVNCVWWLSKTPWPKADNKNVLVPYSPDMERLIKRGYKAKQRPSGHNVTEKWGRDQGGAICSNLLSHGNNDSNGSYLKLCEAAGMKPHPARFPPQLPEFFIKFLTVENDLVVDIFGGSNTTGWVAERLRRRWLAFEADRNYLQASKFRFAGGEAVEDTRSDDEYPLPTSQLSLLREASPSYGEPVAAQVAAPKAARRRQGKRLA